MMSDAKDGKIIKPQSNKLKKAQKSLVPLPSGDGFVQLIGDPPKDRPTNIPMLPINAAISNTVPVKSFDEPENKYQEFIKNPNLYRSFAPTLPGNKLIPRYIGPPRNQAGPPPRRVTVPKAYIPRSTGELALAGRLLSNRSTDGRIMGSYRSIFVDEANVPALPVENPVGPENPVKALNDTWSACWDDQAGAVYYYNNITGEATWISPL